MPEESRRLLGMGVPCLIAFLLDVTLTLLGQPTEYWAGDYSYVLEASPLFNDLLRTHPLAALAGGLLWVVLFLGLLLLLPELLAVIACIAVVFGHTAGAITWMLWYLQWSYQIINVIVLAVAVVLGAGLFWTLKTSARQEIAPSRRKMPAVLRSLLIGILLGLACLCYLVPRWW